MNFMPSWDTDRERVAVKTESAAITLAAARTRTVLDTINPDRLRVTEFHVTSRIKIVFGGSR